MKQKLGRKLLSFLLALVLVLGLVPGMGLTAYADGDTYTITIPSTLNVASSGWNATSGISATGTLATGLKLTVTAASTNGWTLKSGNNSVGYNLAIATGNYSSSATPASWEFTTLSSTATSKPMGIIVEDYSTKPAGIYTDTVTFTATVVMTLTIGDVTITYVEGETWWQVEDKNNIKISYIGANNTADPGTDHGFCIQKLNSNPMPVLCYSPMKTGDWDRVIRPNEKVGDLSSVYHYVWWG